jgi:hypothetical protein
MKKKLYWIILIIAFLGCKKDENSLSPKHEEKIVDNSQLLKGWKSFAQDSLKVNIPNTWNPKKIKDALFYVPLRSDDLYYVILKYNTQRIKTKDYVKGSFDEVAKKDPKFNYILKKIDLQNTNECYIIEFFSIEKQIKYKIYSLIYQQGNQLFDFSYKTFDNQNDNAKNYQTFYTVALSFEYNYDNIFDGIKLMVENEKELHYEDL